MFSVSPASQEAHEIAVVAANFVKTKVPRAVSPRIGIICGSGLASLTEDVTNAVEVPYSEIPDFPRTSVAGHSGSFVFGEIGGIEVVLMKGRHHMYEGLSFEQVTRGLRVMVVLGIETLVVTNAAGAINESFEVGDIVMIQDHLALPSLSGRSPLIGPTTGERFIDLTAVYSPRLKDLVRHCVAKDPSISIQEGVFTWIGGPTYETPAEIHALKVLGADCVAMSTVPEVLIAAHYKLRVIGFSMISDKCLHVAHKTEADFAKMKSSMTSHHEVLQAIERSVPKFRRLLVSMLETMHNDPTRWGKDGVL